MNSFKAHHILQCLVFMLACGKLHACEDVTGSFPITSVTWFNKDKDCAFAAERRYFRCKQIVEFQENCPRTCELCAPTASPTLAPVTTPTTPPPTSSPTEECVDVAGSFPITSVTWFNEDKDCAFAAERRYFRCKQIVEFQEKCPRSCELCPPTASPTLPPVM